MRPLCRASLVRAAPTVSKTAQTTSAINPTRINAGSPDLKRRGRFYFLLDCVLGDAYFPPGNSGPPTFYGKVVPLTTCFLSSTQLRASVPSTLAGSARHDFGVATINSAAPIPPYVGLQLSLLSISNTVTIDGSTIVPGSTPRVDLNGSNTLQRLTTYTSANLITIVFPSTFIRALATMGERAPCLRWISYLSGTLIASIVSIATISPRIEGTSNDELPW